MFRTVFGWLTFGRNPVEKRISLKWFGGVAERFKAPVLKTGVQETVPWVRIPPPPPHSKGSSRGFLKESLFRKF